MKKNQIILLKPSEKPGEMIYLPTAQSVLEEPEFYERKSLLPFLTVPGEFIDEKYNGLKFHLIAHSTEEDDMDFRLTDQNKYEVLGYNPENLEANEELFYDLPEKPIFLEECDPVTNYSSYQIEKGAPTWAQITHTARSLNAEAIDKTDYDSPYFKDRNGEKMEFIMASCSIEDIFGYYYLFYSPKTKLVRQFFECT